MGVGDAMISRIVDLKAQRPIKGQQKSWKKWEGGRRRAGEDDGRGFYKGSQHCDPRAQDKVTYDLENAFGDRLTVLRVLASGVGMIGRSKRGDI